MESTVSETLQPEVGTREWYQHVVAPALKYPRLHDFQLELALAIQNGLDGAILASCGMGKSACFYVPVKAAILRHGEALMILVVPTKALSEDQAKSTNARGLRAVAINRDTM
ncbi:hypothetical protein NEOLEDRAFT_1180796 [Neolentinus lepideus HHB14362 ss-1]|uniref:DEAD/DEAH-box helicase domain-containing protein n=1 Tax=Neolentinus lepideus HHB14362 ss-1 TaxID=1314782 RepID=A0A165QKM5_9AGAM|nr:hypothetical protein NEOLEDRAFT_1180796 [Neolentinus lepideus HHB14362 ss-1]